MNLEQVSGLLAPVLTAHPEVRFAALFGSAVRRGPVHARDIDVAVGFRRSLSLMERGALMAALERAVGKEVDLVDVDEASTMLLWDVVREGVLLTAPDRDAWLNFRARVPIEYADLRPYFDRESEGQRRALARTTWSG